MQIIKHLVMAVQKKVSARETGTGYMVRPGALLLFIGDDELFVGENAGGWVLVHTNSCPTWSYSVKRHAALRRPHIYRGERESMPQGKR